MVYFISSPCQSPCSWFKALMESELMWVVSLFFFLFFLINSLTSFFFSIKPNNSLWLNKKNEGGLFLWGLLMMMMIVFMTVPNVIGTVLAIMIPENSKAGLIASIYLTWFSSTVRLSSSSSSSSSNSSSPYIQFNRSVFFFVCKLIHPLFSILGLCDRIRFHHL